MFTIILLSLGIAMLRGSSKNRCFAAVGVKKCMLDTLKKRCVFWMVVHFGTAPALLLPSFQLADRFGSDVANICIPMIVPPLPSLDIRHDHWTLARKTTWQHLLTVFPAIIYSSSVGKNFWVALLGTTHCLCSMKCVNPSTEDVSNVT